MTLFEKYSYKQKNLALLIIAVLLFAVSYKRAFSKTIETNSYINELEIKKLEALNSQKEIQILQKQVAQLNKLLGKENVSVEEVQQGFLNFLARKSPRISVKQIDEVYGFEHPDFKINTFKIELKGDFISILKFINTLEQSFDDARLIHFQMSSEKDPVTGKIDLTTTLLIQNYVQKVYQ
ncbi:MAG: hypothetical protein K0S23_1263 [Fluviicola sp.]|jgi:wobble nucleotide-excising tRNase|uniref:hypothetical protein n=1 Tax=Fluviicola sp. TaxID=1917219 RepID=UPI002629C3AB|nr:hypothetical protein [Fluviicola sp.]MDF3026956.1 hypothetical protein [Fluviicola sp.]